MSIAVCFHQETDVPDELLKFAVIAARAEGKWIFCRHKERNTYEIPGGHRETGEAIADTAKRELYEETGALKFKLAPLGVYSVDNDGQITYGKLFYAEVQKFGELPEDFEIGEVVFSDTLPQELTYPAIQPYLLKKASDFAYWIREKNKIIP
ncbi:NUDIX hydrolase [Syntrophobotulus glycolicus DSM 8271]|uniref:NUDIX hydrolase n=1 Tax=Syntrophobotulus glycolicus (strain DSM 8271 / FlGlyR) TaxID=645991 RepID=F0T2G8_SYNGF|nr:NUDIX domain-containing protein [Syntrophobotulus glycolicus]ADY55286.1 NUDIX hydrolase [Syntrophobotulus glycolicus DSM 8271]